jgi:hypothetical protein
VFVLSLMLTLNNTSMLVSSWRKHSSVPRETSLVFGICIGFIKVSLRSLSSAENRIICTVFVRPSGKATDQKFCLDKAIRNSLFLPIAIRVHSFQEGPRAFVLSLIVVLDNAMSNGPLKKGVICST